MHFPVMLPEVLTALRPQPGETYVDGTFGNGGYSEAILRAADCNVVAFDRDPNVKSRADELAAAFSGRFKWIEATFSTIAQFKAVASVDAVVLDVGVSSMQIDRPARGFSFMRSGPLDMRMGASGPTAADAVARLSEEDLARIFMVYGEEKQARRAAKALVQVREASVFTTTDQLAEVIENTLGRRGKIHPATKIFQALRIFINDELGELYRGMCAAEEILKPGGRLIVVSFHSLEDRLVKKFMARRGQAPASGSRHMPDVRQEGQALSFKLPSRSVTKPSKAELSENPRSRSAKLRCAVRTEVPAFPADDDLLPRAPRLSDYRWAA
jgi:16S rRNA (cytosine1402-N4)-methyltransferase